MYIYNIYRYRYIHIYNISMYIHILYIHISRYTHGSRRAGGRHILLKKKREGSRWTPCTRQRPRPSRPPTPAAPSSIQEYAPTPTSASLIWRG